MLCKCNRFVYTKYGTENLMLKLDFFIKYGLLTSSIKTLQNISHIIHAVGCSYSIEIVVKA